MFGPSNPSHLSFDKQLSCAKPVPTKVAFNSSSDSKFVSVASNPRSSSAIPRLFKRRRFNLVSFAKCRSPLPDNVGQSSSRETRLVSDSSWERPGP